MNEGSVLEVRASNAEAKELTGDAAVPVKSSAGESDKYFAPHQLKLLQEDDAAIRLGSDLDLEPVDATFRDSGMAPLHSWFPYLEGYSPRFVDRVRKEFLGSAERIIEPFAGSGTTPIVLGQAGIECSFSEANPAMQLIAETKLAVLRLDRDQRHALARRLSDLADMLHQAVACAHKDEGLVVAYREAFGSSIFFDDLALDSILRLRTVNDHVITGDSLLGYCTSVAILSSLIPASRLKRAGDLRYRTEKELSVGLPDVVQLVKMRLLRQADDLLDCGELRANVRFACATAVDLPGHLGKEWDGIITSPPYLNGTNYIRNARLELWFLRMVKSSADIRRLRDSVITSGICDVSAQTIWQPVTPGVERVVGAIQASSYDTRIAKMVGGYFNDMSRAFASFEKCLVPGGRICVDIGDSIYNHVHVPTDDLLVEVAESVGFKTLERIHLRKRTSKGGAAVRQQLLVFELPRKAATRAQPAAECAESDAPDWRSEWDGFKKVLPHQVQPYSKRDWGGAIHSMCSYQGKMKPALAHHLVKCFSAPGDVVIDPFSGAGTIPLEACRMGRLGFGIDISRLGHVLTLAKVKRVSPEDLDSLLGFLESHLESYRPEPGELERAARVRFNSSIPDYFHADTLREILAARAFFLSRWDSGVEWAVLFSCTLHLLHGNRPYALSRRSHPVTPYKPTGDFEYRQLMPRLRQKLARLREDLTETNRAWGGSAQGDCTGHWPNSIPQGDVIITSPPFFDSTRFYMTNWMRFWFVGWEREDFDTQAGDYLETKQKQSFDVYHLFYAAARERLRDGGRLVLHLGKSAKCDMGSELKKRVAPWFNVEDEFTEGVEHCESHGIRDKGAVHGHTYLVLTAC